MDADEKIQYFKKTVNAFLRDYPRQYVLGEIMSAMAMVAGDITPRTESDMNLEFYQQLKVMADSKEIGWRRLKQVVREVANRKEPDTEPAW